MVIDYQFSLHYGPIKKNDMIKNYLVQTGEQHSITKTATVTVLKTITHHYSVIM